MERYVTGLSNTYDEFVFHEGEKKAAADAIESSIEWVWQYADSKEHALRQHEEKMDAYEANLREHLDNDAPILDTY